MTSFVFKIIAMVTMVCDHIGTLLFPDSVALRCIGRCAFVIYAFLMAESFRHLRDRPDRITYHLQKLSLLILVTEVPYDYVETGSLDDPSTQTAAFTLLLGFGALALADRFRDNWKTQALIYLSAAAASYYIRSNFKLAGVLLIVAFFYYLQQFEHLSVPRRMLWLLAIMLAYWPIYILGLSEFGGVQAWIDTFVRRLPWLAVHIALVVPLACYNGQLGYRSKAFNFVYSWFYPLHFAVLSLVRFFFVAG